MAARTLGERQERQRLLNWLRLCQRLTLVTGAASIVLGAATIILLWVPV